MEPTWQLLDITYDLSLTKSLKKLGVYTNLFYQFYVLLQKKERLRLKATALETIRPVATAGMHHIENHFYT